MKRFIAVLSGLLVLPAFAEIAPAYYYEEMLEYSDEYAEPITEKEENQQEQEEQQKIVTPVVPTAVSPRSSNGRAAASRTVATSTTTSARNVSTRNVSATTPARTVVTRSATTTASRATPTRPAASTTTNTTASKRPSTTTRTSTQTPGVTSRTSTQTNNVNTARASIVQTDTVNVPLYRVSTTSSVRSRIPTISVGTTTASTTTESTTSSSMSLDELAQLTDFCKAQYTACMDNFCNVLDDNQGRCSCSANLKNYTETEEALKKATEELQDVAQKIQYIGLTSEEIETLFTQTEAELEMQQTTDNTQLKHDLDKIKSMIIDVESTSASTSSSLSLDLTGLLDFTIDSTGFNLSSLLGTDTSSISNQRGEQLYKTAVARCKASVLNSCAAQGVDTSIITNAYDLEIDKQCIAYERSLSDSNTQMSSTVRNATSVLQKARLLVAQQKNTYDLRGCINALDSCMQDDFVCGDDYENCLDPTGKFIVNGEVVVGSKPGIPGDIENADIYETWVYDTNKNAWATENDGGSLSDYIEKTVTETSAQVPSVSMSEFLQNKIGYHDNSDGKNYGMCISILNKCQDVTYTGSGQNVKYNPKNNVIKEFLNRTLIQIKSAQDEVLADFAESCILDVASCLAQNNYDETETTSQPGTGSDVGSDTGRVSTRNNIAINACKSIITSCMSVNGNQNASTNSELSEWVQAMFNNN